MISKIDWKNLERSPGTMNNESLRWFIQAKGTLNSTLRSRLLAISPELTHLNSSPDLISPQISYIWYLHIQWFHTYAHFHVAILLEGEKDSKSSLFQPPSVSPPTCLSTLEVAGSKHLSRWCIEISVYYLSFLWAHCILSWFLTWSVKKIHSSTCEFNDTEEKGNFSK